MHKGSGLLIFSLAAVVLPANGQAQKPTSKTYVLKAARMFDGKSNALATPGLVVVTDGKITAVGAKAAVPAGAEVIDLGDATLLPGFIDAHTHLTMMYSDDWKQNTLDGLQKTIAEQALDASANARVTLMAGFTTVRDVGSRDYLDVGLRNAIYGADIIKVCATGGVLSLTDDVDTPQLTQEELNAIVDEAHALRRKTAAHAHGNEGAKRAILAGIDSIEHGSFMQDETLDLMKQRGTYLVPTLIAGDSLREKIDKGLYLPPAIIAKTRAALAARSQMFQHAVAKGVKIGFGTDAAVYPHGRNAEQFHLMVDLGMKPIDALRSAALPDAELLGLQDKLGTLESGKLADIVAVPGDPVENIRQTEKVFFVMKEGVIHRNDRGAPQR